MRMFSSGKTEYVEVTVSLVLLESLGQVTGPVQYP